MIRQWFILFFLLLVVLALSVDLYKKVIMYNPLQDIEVNGKGSTIYSKQVVSVSESGWGKEIIENNLFSPLRNPVQPKPQSQMKPADIPKKPEMSLKGIILDSFGDYVAYVEKDKAKAVPVRKGDSLDDVEVVDVKQKSVELRWNEEMIFLTLDKIKTIKGQR